MHLIAYSAMSPGAFISLKVGVVIPLALACLVLIVLIPSAAWRGKLSVPIYALLALASGTLAFAAGTLAGARTIRGTPLGVVISILFFLLLSAGSGCFLSLLFYRQPRQEDELTPAGDGGKPSTDSRGEPDR
jgi:hypothetical protein